MKNRWILLGSILGVLVLALAAGLSQAQGPEPPGEGIQPQDVSIEAAVNSRISYQGVLKENGQPVNGTRNMTFRFYTNSTCTGTPVQTVTKSNVQVSNGLFTVALDVNQANFNGQGLWVAVDVGGTVVGCQEILPVPYALSLRPGAIISGTVPAPGSLLMAKSPGGSEYIGLLEIISVQPFKLRYVGIRGEGDIGVYGYSNQADGYGGYFENTNTANNGVALKAGGTGIIQSTAVSRIFVPGTEAVPHSDSRSDLEFRYYGRGLVEVRKTSAGAGVEKILIPVAIPAVLYGQPVRVYDLRVYYGVSNANSAITATYLYRQSITPSSPTWWPGYSTVITNTVPQTSTNFTYYHMYCTAPECRLGAEASILTVELDLYFASTNDVFAIGGVRLTLEHD